MRGLNRPRPGHPALAGRPLLIAHRGGARLAPENTMAAFRRAVELWRADMLELDVRLTLDGEVVVVHDATVDRTTDGSGDVAARTWPELRELDAGHRFTDGEGRTTFRGEGVTIPRFEEVLEAFPDVRLAVEPKAAEAAAPLAELVRRHGAGHRVVLGAEHEANRKGARGTRAALGASRSQVRPWVFLHATPLGPLYTPGVDVFQVPEAHDGRRIVTPRFVEEAHRRNIPVHVWTVDDEGAMRRLLALGVDGIQSDRPDVLARVLADVAGRPLPPGCAPDGPS